VLRRIVEGSARNPFLVGLGIAGLLVWGSYALVNTPLDAIPDLSDVQVIVFTEVPGQAPQVVEDQVTYPLSTAMLSVPFAKVVRGYSFFGLSFVYIIFEDGTDLYWARSRVLESLNFVSRRLPPGITPTLGPDATGVGWVYEYALVDRTGQHDLADLRSLQDWHLRYELQTVPGVAEVASVGGHVRQYQVEVDPNQLAAYGIPLAQVRHAIMRSNSDIGGKLVEQAETEFMVRSRGYLGSTSDLEQIAVGANESGTPILLRNVATVSLGPELRRGLTDLDGEGDVAAGVVIMRVGENALETIRNVKQRLAELAKNLPAGVEIVPVYDRAPLIERAVENLREKLLEQGLIVALVCFVFLVHVRSALVAILILPFGILISFIVMFHQGINANIMSLGGIAIAMGTMIDAGIVMVENAHKHLERDRGKRPRREILIDAAVEVGPSLFFSLLIITVSFLPIFALQAQEGRLFKPLAFTKTYAMAGAALLSITVVPALMIWLVRGRILPEARNPLNRAVLRVYRPLLGAALRHRYAVLGVALVLLGTSLYPLNRIGSEFMPPLDEGDLLYMPTTLPGLSITKARELLQQTDRIIATLPEVERVFGKIGRADTATDPAPLSMIETTITLKPRSEWRPGMTPQKLIAELDGKIRFPGLTNAWTMPIKTRIDMLSTGIKTPVGIKISGAELSVLEELGQQIEAVLREVPGTQSVYAERVVGGNYLDLDIDRERIARYGLTVGDVQDVIQTAIGGVNITQTVEGLERYPVNLRYSRELREDLSSLQRVLVAIPGGAQVPLEQLVTLRYAKGPPAIKTENARPNAWVYIDLDGIDLGSYVQNARAVLQERVSLPAGYTLHWSGQYEYLERAQRRLALIVPITLGVIFLLLYLNFRRLTDTLLVIAGIPFALVGGLFLVWVLDYDFSVAVGAGFLALAGLAAETGVIMLLFLNQARDRALELGSLQTVQDLWRVTVAGATDRARPLLMTVASDAIGLLPIMWGAGTGSETMRRIAAPMVGGVLTATLATLIIIPVLFALVHARGLARDGSPATPRARTDAGSATRTPDRAPRAAG
jgi:Cu(I)/Ag(I) efflux system membrane protein CusA/SilA